MAFLELNGVGKSYGKTPVLRDINLHIDEGEFVAVVGYSGAGKTTLINMIAGLAKPDAGTITVAGKPVVEPGPELGVVFQNYSLLPWMTVRENVRLGVAQVYRGWTRAQIDAHVERYVGLVNLTHAKDRKPAELSGGMRQRTALARAMAMNPRVLLMDEPLSALDALTRATLQDEMARIRSEERKTMLLITNDVDEGILLADRIIPLSQGPGATLGPAVEIDIPRPRDRKAINHDKHFRKVRNEVLHYLLGEGRRDGKAVRAVQAPHNPEVFAPVPSVAVVGANA